MNEEKYVESIWNNYMYADFVYPFNAVAERIEEIADEQGFNGKWNDGEKIALMHSELSECLEALRQGNPKSEHIPKFTAVEEELADVIIRVMHFAVKKNHRVAEAILEKVSFNKSRPHKHGGKKF